MNAYQPRTAPSYAHDITDESFHCTGAPIFGYDSPANYIPPTSLEISLRPMSKLRQFTGKERDSESGLDYFGARYYGSALGRFTSPDPIGNFAADATNPQSWNLYSYVWGNPLANIDPTGMTCVDTSNGKADDGDGQGCKDAGVSPSTAAQRATGQDILNPQHADVNGKNPSELEYTWTMLTQQIPRYDPNDIPVNPYPQAVLNRLGKLIDDYPTVCGGGTYKYLGKEIDAGPFSGFAGVIKENDSRTGSSSGALFEGGGGEGVVGGVGYVASTTGGQAQGTGLAYLGLGGKTNALSGSVGVVGFGSAPKIGGVGVYAEGFLSGRGGGVGAYANISRIGSCQ